MSDFESVRSIMRNPVKCGTCKTEYDADKNNGCPQCGAGRNYYTYRNSTN